MNSKIDRPDNSAIDKVIFEIYLFVSLFTFRFLFFKDPSFGGHFPGVSSHGVPFTAVLFSAWNYFDWSSFPLEFFPQEFFFMDFLSLDLIFVDSFPWISLP